MRYAPEYIPVDADARTLVEYLTRELYKISSTLDNPEMTADNYGKEVVTTVTTSTSTIYWKKGNKQRVKLQADSLISFVAPEGVCDLHLVIEYSGTYTPTFDNNVFFAGGIAPTWTSNGIDVLHIYYDGTNYHVCACPLDSKTLDPGT